jgi:hypothetical protein
MNVARYEVLMFVIRLSIISAIGIFSTKWICNQLDPSNKQKQKAKKKVKGSSSFKVASLLT